MRHLLLTSAAIGSVLASLMAMPAEANNAVVENALKSRPELSVFYEGLVSTGVINELQEGQSYTIFAPTNAAFAKLPPSEYPCFYAVACKAQVADILRTHIVPGEKHLSDIGREPGGIMSLFTIDRKHITANNPSRDRYEVDGNMVLSESQLNGSILYRLNGVLATPREMVQFTVTPVTVVHAVGSDLPPRVPEGKIVTITTDLPPQFAKPE